LKIVSVINYKGGVGKTTLTANLGAELARRGSRVLLVDLDPQCSLTFSFYSPNQAGQQLPANRTIKAWYDTFVDGMPQRHLSDFIVVPQDIDERIADRGGHLGLLPSSLKMIDVDLRLLANAGLSALPVDLEVYRLRKALADALSYGGLAQYDYVLADCAPNFNIVTQAAVVASHRLLIPAKPDHLSTLGIESLLAALDNFKETYNNQCRAYSSHPETDVISPDPLGVVFTMVRYKAPQPIADHQYYMERVKKNLPNMKVFNATIRENVAFGRDEADQPLPVVLRSSMTHNYYVELMELATEFERSLGSGSTRKRAVA
jgi:chromosome partitioning protein